MSVVHVGLVSGFVTLQTFMTAESTEVLWELLLFSKEVSNGGLLAGIVELTLYSLLVQHTCLLLKNSIENINTRNKVTPEQQAQFLQSVAK